MAQARSSGIELTGLVGLLTDLTRQVFQAALEVEISDHLGYERGDPAGVDSGNSQKGTTAKTVRADFGEVHLDVPRYRAGTFSPGRCPEALTPPGQVR